RSVRLSSAHLPESRGAEADAPRTRAGRPPTRTTRAECLAAERPRARRTTAPAPTATDRPDSQPDAAVDTATSRPPWRTWDRARTHSTPHTPHAADRHATSST